MQKISWIQPWNHSISLSVFSASSLTSLSESSEDSFFMIFLIVYFSFGKTSIVYLRVKIALSLTFSTSSAAKSFTPG